MKKIIGFAVKLGFMVAAFTVIFRPETFGLRPDLFQDITPRSLIEVLKDVDLGTAIFWLGFAVVVKLGGITAGIVRWRLLLYGQGVSIPFWYLTKCWFMGRAIGLFLPGTLGLDGYRLVESSRYTGEAIKCTTVIAVEKLIGFIALATLVFLTLPLGLRILEFNLVVLGIVLTILLTFILICFLLLLNPRVVQVLLAVVPTPTFVRSKLTKLGVAITAYSGHRGILMLAVVLGLCVHLGICLMYFGTASAIRAENTGLLDILFASPLVIVGSVIGPTVSGMGVREVVMGYVLGDQAGAAAAVTFGHLGLWAGEIVPFVLSLPLLLFTTRPKREDLMSEVEALREATTGQDGESTSELALSDEAVREYRNHLISCILAGIFAGLIGGALAGLLEAGWHIHTLSYVAEVSAYGWAPLVYGIVFSGLGFGAAAVLIFFYLLFDRFPPWTVTFGLSLGTTLAVLTLVLGRFRFQRDVLGEHALSLMQNVMVLGAALAIGVAVAVSAALLAGFLWKRPSVALGTGLATYLGLVGLGMSLAAIRAPVVEAVSFAPKTKATGPNMLLIVVDTLRADYVEVFNPASLAKTPNINKLAGDAVRFEKTFAQSSWTKASFGTIFSGMYPEAHSATGKASALPEEIITFAEVLKAGGYYTRGFSNNPNITSVFNYHQGFVEYTDLKPDLYFGATPSCEKLVLYDILRKVVQIVNAKFRGGRIIITDFYQPGEEVTQRGLDWLDDANRPADTPFMLFLHYMDPHDPFRDPDKPGKGYARVQLGSNPDPEKYLDVFKAAYTHEVEYMDTEVGRLLDGLRERGIYDDTLIVFTADHGEEFYEHGGWWHGLSLYDEQIHIPLMMKLPGNPLAGVANTDLARHVDIAPTLAQFAGLPGDESWQGQSLFDADLTATNATIPQIYSHLDFEGIQLRAVRTQTEKLIQANEGNKRDYAQTEFYNLETDPGEQHNLAGQDVLTEAVFNKAIDDMREFISKNAAEPSIRSLEEMSPAELEQLNALGYLGDKSED